MSEQIQKPTESSELETLKQRANLMGITYHPNIGLEKLKEKVNNALSGGQEAKDIKNLSTGKSNYLDYDDFRKKKAEDRKREAGKLVRCRITCMNPNKKEWEGEIISVGSAKLGTFKKYIPFNTDEDGWHIPKIMYDFLKERKCTMFHTVKDARGQKIRKSRLVPEFSIETLPPLTKAQLKDLEKKQALENGQDQ